MTQVLAKVLARLLAAAARRKLAAVALLWLQLLMTAPGFAATYAFRSDSYAWETAATAVTWDRTCTGFPGDDDKATLTFTGGFTFPFAGTAYGSVRVLSNGMLQFGGDTGFFRNYDNTTLPAGNATPQSGCTAGATTNALMAYWTDLDPSRVGSGNVTWAQKGSAPNRYVVVSWNGVYEYNTSTPYSFQIILYENGEFKYQYGNGNTTGSNATIGVQVNAADYTQYSYNSGYNANGSAVRWFIPSGVPTRVAEYRMDEFSWSGTVGEVTDSSGNGHHGVRVGSAANHASGYVCRGLDVPGNTSTAIAAVDTALDVDTGIGRTGGVSFWYRAGTPWNGAAAAMLLDATTNASRPFYLQRGGSGTLRFAVSDSAGTVLVAAASSQSYPANQWVHVVGTWRLAAGAGQSTLRLYVNGLQVGAATGTTNGNLDPSLGSLFIGDNRSAATPAGATSNSANGRIDEVRIYNYEASALEIADDMAVSHSCLPPLHHVELQHGSGTGLTCTPASLRVVACQDAGCTTRYTGGVTGTLSATGSPTVVWPGGPGITIPAGASSVDVAVQVTTPGSVVFGASGMSPAASSATSCNFGSPACTFTAADAGLLFDVPNHTAETAQTVAIAAVRKADNAAVCVPAFASVTKSVNVSCAFQNPASGSLPLRVGGVSIGCGGAGSSVSLAFDANGTASTSVQYADVGQLQMTVRYTGSGNDAGLVMSGSDSFIAAPANFAFSAVTGTDIRAGLPFGATLTARNAAGAATPNFSRETPAQSPTLGWLRRQPTGAGARDGSFSGSLGAFSNGAASASNLTWTEVGRGDLTASLANYLGSGLGASGATVHATTPVMGMVGRFLPHHFDVTTAHACSNAFSYARQPFVATVTARNAANAVTENYDGSVATTPNFARAVSLADAPSLGGDFAGTNAIAASAFLRGVATGAPAYGFADKQTPESLLVLRASDTDATSSAGHAEGSTPVRSGRLRVANGYGSEKAALQLQVLAEYWSGAAWVQNNADSCTAVPAAAVARSNYRNHQGAAGAWSTTPSAIAIVAGAGVLTLSAPSPAATGTVDFTLNLGSSAADQSCLATHPASTGAAVHWLRSRNGSCAATWDRDPSARASFGIYSPETKKTVHVREIF